MNPREDLRPVGQEDRSDQACLEPVVAVPIHILVRLISSDRRKRTVLVGYSSTIGVAVGTVGTTVAAEVAGNRAAGAREVAATAAGRCAVTLEIVAVGIVAVVLSVVLAWRDQCTELETLEDRRLVPDGVVHAPIELGPVVSAGIAHDRIVIPKGSRERIHRGCGFLVRRVALASLDRAPRSLHPYETVARSNCGALVRGRCEIDLIFQFLNYRHALPPIR